MSTYTIAFFISDFAEKTVQIGGSRFSAFSRPDQVNNTEFALKTAVDALLRFEIAFNATYGSKKLDQVALPVFNYGGMENNFIVFYIENAMIYESGVTTVQNKEISARMIVHEVSQAELVFERFISKHDVFQLCHSFFGNQLTYNWWSVVWLSEGFCRFYEHFMTNEIYPEMKLDKLFAVNSLQKALKFDSNASTRPMTYYVETPSEILSLFGTISYDKGEF
jgi:aminopeptidase N